MNENDKTIRKFSQINLMIGRLGLVKWKVSSTPPPEPWTQMSSWLMGYNEKNFPSWSLILYSFFLKLSRRNVLYFYTSKKVHTIK